jgi:bifunctional non-homologous end joining protein LigD
MTLPQIKPIERVRMADPFDDPGWLFELKHDGFRAVVYLTDGQCRLVSRKGHTYKSFVPLRAALGEQLRAENVILDGEIVCLDQEGRSIFNELLYRRGNPVFYAFDLCIRIHNRIMCC